MLSKKLAKRFRKDSEKLVETRWRYLLASERRYLLQVVAVRKKLATAVTVFGDFRTFEIPWRELLGQFTPFKYLGTAIEMEWLRPGGWMIAKNPNSIPRSRIGAWRIRAIERDLVLCHERLRPENNESFHRNLFVVVDEFREATAEEREEGRRLALMPAPRMPEPPTDEEVQAALDAAQAEAEPEVERQPFWKNLVEEDV